MIDHKNKLIFIHIARTGGTSIETALVGSCWSVFDPETKHISASQAKKIYGDSVWESYTKFSVIRNPWDRIASMRNASWWHLCSGLEETCSFEEFIVNLKPHPNEKYNTLFYHEIIDIPVNFILRFEFLQKDFSDMLCEIGIKDIILPHVEKRQLKSFKLMYEKKEEQLVSKIFRKDIMKYKYVY